MEPLWHIELLGGLRVVGREQVITRFRSHKTGALLAYLAFHLSSLHPRDLLVDLLWPDEPLDSARMRLRTALSSLRRQLEPPGIPAGAVLIADRQSVGLNPAAVTTDVARFEADVQAAGQARDPLQRDRHLVAAVEPYRGPLLPGYFEAWVLPEQQRLAEQFFQSVWQLIGRYEQAGDRQRALDLAGRLVAMEPLREEAHAELIRLLAVTGQPAAARRQYQALAQRLQEEWGETPSPAIRQLLQRIERGELPLSPPRSPARWNGSEPEPPPAPASPSPPSGLTSPSESNRGFLPPLITRFFGREAEIARVRRLLHGEGVRLVTLTGPGGSGKTRLALEAAARLWDALDGAVWFVPLADLSDPQRIIDAVHAALRLHRLPQVEVREQVVAALSRRPGLLVLDNLEHLMPGAVPVIRALLEAVPLLQGVVTSRQVLGLLPEREIAVGPLGTPPPAPPLEGEGRLSPEQLLACDSVALFVDRAQRIEADFQLTRRNAEVVAELCRRLEGIPLALELAAAWVRQVPPARMLGQLAQRFEVLVARQRDLPSRHQTLRAALEWSYQLLSPEVQRFFARLFVFRGGFTAEAAAAVCEASAKSEGYLAQLRDHSLVVAEDDRSGKRFRLLEMLREYAAEQLTREEQDEAARRHAEYFLDLAEAAEHALVGPEERMWLDRLERDHDNLRAAVGWLRSSGEVELGLRLGASLVRFWQTRGCFTEGRERLAGLLELPSKEDTATRAKALNAAGALAYSQGDYAAVQALCERSLAIARALGAGPMTRMALHRLAEVALDRNDDATARRFWEEGLALARAERDRRGIGAMLNCLGVVASRQGDSSAAQAFYEESLAIFRELGAQLGIANATINLGGIARSRGDYSAALALFEEALVIGREVGSRIIIPDTLYNLGILEQQRGSAARARKWYQECLLMHLETANRGGIEQCLCRLVQVSIMQAKPQRAARLIGATEAVRRIRIGQVPAALWPADDPDLVAARTLLGEETFTALRAEGRAMAPEQAIGDGEVHPAPE